MAIICLNISFIISLSANSFPFQLRLASGAFVTFRANPYGSSSYSDLSVHIPPIDFRHTVGMCGTFDGNPGNDQQKPDGQNVGGRGSPAFTESWRLVVCFLFCFHLSAQPLQSIPSYLLLAVHFQAVPVAKLVLLHGTRVYYLNLYERDDFIRCMFTRQHLCLRREETQKWP